MVCIPIIMVAAFIESYLTRFTEIPGGLRSLVIIFSLLFIVYYFVVMPWLKYRGNRDFDLEEDQPKAEDNKAWKSGDIYSLGELLIFSLTKLRSRFTMWMVTGLLLGTLLFFLARWLGNDFISEDIRFQLRKSTYQSQFNEVTSRLEYIFQSLKLASWNMYACRYLFYLREFPAIFFVHFLLWTVVLIIAGSESVETGNLELKRGSFWWKMPLLALVPVCLIYLSGSLWWLMLLFIWPILGKTLGLGFYAFEGGLFKALLFSFRLFFQRIFRFVGAVFLVLILYAIASFGMWLLITVILSFTGSMHNSGIYSNGILLFYTWLNYVIWPLLLLAGLYFYRLNGITLYEKQTGSKLLKRIDEIGFRKEVYGVESE
jgi:hypothetical protein